MSKASSPFFSLQRSREPGASQGISADMPLADKKAEFASTYPSVPGRTSRADPYSGGEIRSFDTVAPRSATKTDGDLPRVKLEIPGGNNANLSIPRPQVGPDHLNEAMDTSQEDFDASDEHDQESTVSPSDEKSDMAGGDGSHRSPTLEMKKKMKRFRYGSHGWSYQTRLLTKLVA